MILDIVNRFTSVIRFKITINIKLVTAKLKWFNLALRGIMEFGIVISLAYWGFKTGQHLGIKILLAIGAPLLIFGFWGIIDFRNSGTLSEPLRLIQELVISILAGIAIYTAGQETLGNLLIVISIIHHILVYLLGDKLLKEK